MTIERRQLGKTDLRVTPIGLGCWQFSGSKGLLNRFWWNSPSQEEVDRIVAATLNGGINWFDTAEFYGGGRSERALSTALCRAGKENADVVIATKWWPLLRTARNIPITAGRRLECLSPCRIDLHQIHNPYSFSSVEAQMDEMAGLVKEGRIRYVGVSNFSAAQMRRAYDALARHGLPLASNQVRFSLLDRSLERNGVLDAAKELGVSLIAYSPLAQGLLTGKFHKNPELVGRLPFLRRRLLGRQVEKSRNLITKLEQIAASHNCSVAEAALSWTVNFHGDVVVAIPGATRTEHVRQNTGALTLKLSPAEIASLDKESRLIS